MNDPAVIAEHREMLSRLVDRGFGPLLEALQEPKSFTKGGRIVISAVARELGVSPPRAKAMLQEAQSLAG